MWNIGNEVYGEWQLGHLYVDQYALKHNAFAEAMKAVDPSIKLIASGATPFETSTTARHHRKPLPATLPYQYGSKQDWSYVLLERCSDNIDLLAEHIYPVFNSAFDVNAQAFVQTDDPLVDRVRRVPNRIKGAVEALAEYQKRLPAVKQKNIAFAIDEWAAGPGFPGTLGAAEGLHEMFRHSDQISMAAFTAFSGQIAQNGAETCYTSTGLLFNLYRHHFGTIPLVVTGNAPQHDVKGTIGVDKPVVTSGSDTYPLDVAAAFSTDRKFLTVAVANPTEVGRSIALRFDSVTLDGGGRMWEIAAPNLQARNLPAQAPQVQTIESPIQTIPDRLTLPPLSITLYEFKVK
jgi:alpha-N-arabinofuranosidase